jgi:hypothetical protein
MPFKYRVAVCLLVVVVGCGSKSKEINRIIESPIDYHSHLSPRADMSRYNTWDWLSPLVDEGAVEKQQLEDDIRLAIQSAIELRMRDRNYRHVTSSPDMVIDYQVAGQDIDADFMREKYDERYDPKYRRNFDGPRRLRDSWQEGSIVIFAFDAVTGEIFWRSSAKAEVTDEAPLEQRVERLDEAIKMMFTSLPGK